MTDWGQLYRDNLAAVTSLAADLSAEQLSTRVPATPEWDVHDLLAHLAGEASDLVNDRMDDAPSAEWTERHVQERAARSADELGEELRSNADAMVAAIDSGSTALAWDVAVHHADLHEALGLPRPPDELWTPVLDAATQRYGDAAAVLRDQVDDYEIFRAVFSRRSTAQLAEWDVDGVSVEQLEGACVFGPREDDQPVPEPQA